VNSFRAGLFVRHNAEIAHRLLLLPGKCQQIHGHSLDVELSIAGHIDANGILAGLDFSNVKSVFRDYLDTMFDHQLHLNADDPWANILHAEDGDVMLINTMGGLPGLRTWPGDPTTENFAKWMCEHMHEKFGLPVKIAIIETQSNGAEYELG